MRKREAEQNIEADWEIDAFMTADTAKGKREAIASEYILRILGLDVSIHAVILTDLSPQLTNAHVRHKHYKLNSAAGALSHA